MAYNAPHMNPVWSFLANLILPVTKLIDDVHTSEEEKLLIKAEMFKMQQEITNRVIDYETKLMDNQAKIILAEAQGESWLQRNWRPLMMVWFAILLGMYWFGVTPPESVPANHRSIVHINANRDWRLYHRSFR